jgi:hypothetical protein
VFRLWCLTPWLREGKGTRFLPYALKRTFCRRSVRRPRLGRRFLVFVRSTDAESRQPITICQKAVDTMRRRNGDLGRPIMMCAKPAADASTQKLIMCRHNSFRLLGADQKILRAFGCSRFGPGPRREEIYTREEAPLRSQLHKGRRKYSNWSSRVDVL